MKAIITRYYGPTNHRGARIVAKDSDGNRASVDYPHHIAASDRDAIHFEAVRVLCDRMQWHGALVPGWLSPVACAWVWLNWPGGPDRKRYEISYLEQSRRREGWPRLPAGALQCQHTGGCVRAAGHTGKHLPPKVQP